MQMHFSSSPRIEPILSAEETECGLACLAMVANYYGHQLDLVRLRQRFSLSIAGITLRTIIDWANQLGLGSRALRVELSAVVKVQTPAIIHWDLTHFVVLEKVTGNSATIVDPASGRKTFSLSDFSNHFTGVVLELSRSAEFTPVQDKEKMKLSRLWSNLHGLKRVVCHLMALSLFLQFAVLLGPLQAQLVIDQAIARGDIDLLGVIAAGFAFIMIFSALAEAARSWSLAVLINSATYQVLGNVVHHLFRLPISFFEKRHVGDIISRLNSAKDIQGILGEGLIVALIDGLMAIILVAILYFYSPLLASIALALVFVSLATTMTFYPMLRSASEDRLIDAAREQTYLIESVRGAQTIKVMGREAEREGHWRNLFTRFTNSSIRTSKYGILIQAAQNVVNGAQLIVVLYLGGRLVLASSGFSVGMLVAFMAFRQMFAARISALIQNLVEFRLIRLHLQRLGDITATKAEAVAEDAAPQLNDLTLELDHVSFRYDPSGNYILKDVNMTITPQDFVMLTGPSGGGKTTLLKLMLGLIEPSSGEIRIGGRPATPAIWRQWREMSGVVAQDDSLLAGTIAENISFFDPSLDMKKVRAAAATAAIADDIERMPMQYLSLSGDMGSALSGGQKQRILLARAIYRDPSIIFLDEGTANLDEETEIEITRVISLLPVTRIAVAHRPALIEVAHCVFDVSNSTVSLKRARHSERSATAQTVKL